MPSTINLKAKGLSTSPNNLANDEGGLSVAENIIIRRQDTMESRRGYKLFDGGFGETTDRAKQIISYKERLLVHYSNKIEHETGTTTEGVPNFEDFAGNYSETQDGLRIKSIEANGNLYFTTSEGIKKLSSATSDGLNAAAITNSGGIKALDLVARPKYTPGNTTDFLPADSAVAYRVVWGTKDANENLILGTPSQRAEVYNSLLTLDLQDFQRTLGALDNLNQPGSLINDGNYVDLLGLPINSSASDLYNGLLSLSVKIDQDIVYANNDVATTAVPPFEIDTVAIAAGVCTVTFINVTPGAKVSQYFSAGDKIYLAGTFTPGTSGTITGLQTVATINDTTNAITFTTTAVGVVTIDTTSKIESGTFRNITQPTVPNTPATNNDLESLQTYLQAIITALQLLPTQATIASDTGLGVPLNINAAACSITAGTATITFSSGDPRNYVIAGSYIYLDGFTPVTGTVNGQQLVASVTATTLTFATTATGAIAVGGTATIGKILLFSTALASQFLDILSVTTASTVILNITVSEGVTTDYFYQVYRSSIVTADGVVVLQDLAPGDELQLVYEAYPTQTEIDNREVIVEDITPDAFRGANLYTNASTGEGIAQSNDVPPFAKDINRFKNSIFFANTRTRHRLSLNLLGVTGMIEDANNGNPPQVVISDSAHSNTYTFVVGVKELYEITCVADVAGSLAGKYFYINSANNTNKYYVWYATTLTATDPAISGRAGIRVQIAIGDSAATVAAKTAAAVNVYNVDFNSTLSTTPNTVLIQNTEAGYVDDATDAGATGFSFLIITDGRGEKASKQQSIVGMPSGSTFNNSGTGNFFSFFTAGSKHAYVIWYSVGTATAPAFAAPYTLIPVVILGGDNANTVATKTAAALQSQSAYFTTTSNNNNVTLTSVDYGAANFSSVGGMPGGATLAVVDGALDVLLSDAVSPSIAVDQTARSFVRIVNKNTTEVVSGFYLSGSLDVPGKMFFESETLNTSNFYMLANNETTGASFNPNISPEVSNISSTGAGSVTELAITAHGLQNGDKIVVSGSTGIPSINGLWTITRVDANTISIPVVTLAGSAVGVSKASDAVASSNEEKKNRIYYSKVMQPEAVPLVNYIDAGAEDKAILRIFPLRDSLFVYKEDGLYRISGETAPFTLALFDSSVILIAPDSLAICNNVQYGWTTQGIIPVTEGGASDPISRPIDDQILKFGSSNYTNFSKATWGKGYESDNSYKVWTVTQKSDTVAQIAYRYCTLTQSWTNFMKTNTCGITNPVDDKEYLGAGDVNNIEVERKEFSREDYADRQYEVDLNEGNYNNTKLKFSSVSNITAGDVLVQSQTVSIYQYNQLLKKLDLDPGVADSNYFSTLELSNGENFRTALVDLATKLDADTGVANTTYAASIANLNGVIASFSIANPTVVNDVAHGLLTGREILISGVTGGNVELNGIWEITRVNADNFSIPVAVLTPGTGGLWSTIVNGFDDIKGCYNIIINLLNSDSGTTFSNYQLIETNTDIETVVNVVNGSIKELTVADALPFIQGVITVYKAIPTRVVYELNTMQDSLGFKHCREATIMFQNKAFTRATASFSTDLQPETVTVDFNGDGNGIFGQGTFGKGYFGGASNGAPFRTYVPRQCQRCRYMIVGFSHKIAREQWAIFGTTVTAEISQSTRAYR
jgi:hypothetical protein